MLNTFEDIETNPPLPELTLQSLQTTIERMISAAFLVNFSLVSLSFYIYRTANNALFSVNPPTNQEKISNSSSRLQKAILQTLSQLLSRGIRVFIGFNFNPMLSGESSSGAMQDGLKGLLGLTFD